MIALNWWVNINRIKISYNKRQEIFISPKQIWAVLLIRHRVGRWEGCSGGPAVDPATAPYPAC